MEDEILGLLREAKAKANDEAKSGLGSRELAVVVTNIDNAILWRQHTLQLRAEPVNETNKG